MNHSTGIIFPVLVASKSHMVQFGFEIEQHLGTDVRNMFWLSGAPLFIHC